MTAMITAAVASTAISAYSANRSAKKQAGAINRSTDLQVEEQKRQYDQARRDWTPFREWGLSGIDQLRDPTANFFASPDYEFRRSEGIRDIGNTFAARGSGGNALKALNEFNSNLASQQWGNWYNSRLAQVGIGSGATGAITAAGQNAANNTSAAYGWQGANLANIAADKYTNINNAIQSGISGALFGYLGMPQQVNTNRNVMNSGYGVNNPSGTPNFSGVGWSDRRLKENIEQLGEVGGYKYYQWDWNDKAKSIGVDGPTVGVMADEVPEEFVTEDEHGYLMVDYGRLFGDLHAAV